MCYQRVPPLTFTDLPHHLLPPDINFPETVASYRDYVVDSIRSNYEEKQLKSLKIVCGCQYKGVDGEIVTILHTTRKWYLEDDAERLFDECEQNLMELHTLALDENLVFHRFLDLSVWFYPEGSI